MSSRWTPIPESTSNESDRGPRIRCLPPVLYFGLLLLGFGVHAWWPIPLGGPAVLPLLRWSGLLLVFAGPVLSIFAIREFRRARTGILPIRPAAALVTSGPYGRTRNPMYLGLTASCTGIALFANALAPLVAVGLAALLVRPLIIGPEERHLEARFGDAYRAYRARVRRWL